LNFLAELFYDLELSAARILLGCVEATMKITKKVMEKFMKKNHIMKKIKNVVPSSTKKIGNKDKVMKKVTKKVMKKKIIQQIKYVVPAWTTTISGIRAWIRRGVAQAERRPQKGSSRRRVTK
jgi:hypothetical protein